MQPIDLVTGASGLLGGNLVRSLIQQGRRVRILVRKTSRISHLSGLPDLEPVEGDITLPQTLEAALTGVDTVYHCAAQVSVAWAMTPSIWVANVTGTENVLAAFRESSARRLVHCSSVDAIGLPEDGQPSTEATPWNWDRLGVETAYARTKYESQQRVLQAAGSGLEAVVVCPTYMFGPYDVRPSSGQMILSVQKNSLLPVMRGGNNFVDVQDVVDGMIAAAQVGRPGETYILGGENLEYREIFEQIASILGKRIRFLQVPSVFLQMAGKVGDWMEAGLHREATINSALVRLGNVKHFYDPAKATRELGLPHRSVEAALARTVDWFRQTGMLPN